MYIAAFMYTCVLYFTASNTTCITNNEVHVYRVYVHVHVHVTSAATILKILYRMLWLFIS